MGPPTPFDVGDSSYFIKGSSDRGNDLSDTDHRRVVDYNKNKLKNATYPVATFYPDLA